MKKILLIASFLIIFGLIFGSPKEVFADGGIYASGGGTKTVGETFTVSVQARGAEFDTLQGTISVSGPVDIVSFSAGGASWMPGYTPANGKSFVGIVSPTSSFTVATIKLKGKSVGSGSVSISGAKMARTVGGSASIVGSGSGSTSFSIQRALALPGKIAVTSATHPDPNSSYEATTVSLSWVKDKNVEGFSYLLDQVADTVPQAKITSVDTAITYADQAIGAYYFHIRAKNGDGWGETTHFKINIKEPDAKVNPDLAKPRDIIITETETYTNNVTDGTVSGIMIAGVTEPGYTANITLAPAPTLPEGKTLSALADSTGVFSLIIDYPIRSGFYKLSVQGLLEKVLTPVSDEIRFEISQANGGKITILADEDANRPAPEPEKKWYDKPNYRVISITLAVIFFVTLIVLIVVLVKGRKRYR